MTRWPDRGIAFSVELLNRKTLGTWSIPASIRREYDIVDTDVVTITVSIGAYATTIDCVVTSGGEFGTGAIVKENIEKQLALGQDRKVRFVLIKRKCQYDRLVLERQRLEAEVSRSRKMRRQIRLTRISSAPKKPASRTVETTVFSRNADIIAEALFIADGKCEWCQKAAPFKRVRDQTPYLEVHHKIALSAGGEDTLENVEALCPNCHRHKHFGPLP